MFLGHLFLKIPNYIKMAMQSHQICYTLTLEEICLFLEISFCGFLEVISWSQGKEYISTVHLEFRSILKHVYLTLK